jgi:VWFA-related protein
MRIADLLPEKHNRPAALPYTFTMHRLLLPLLVVAMSASGQEMRTQETITVERILIDARVTVGNGEPILGLEKGDFRVRIDGKPAAVESAEWIPETAAARAIAGIDEEEAKPQPLPSADPMAIPAPAGRLMIFFFQTDVAREQIRVTGQMSILRFADDLIDALEPEDRVAVLSFDSHLKFRLDFTDDKARILGAMHDALLTGEPGPPPIVPSPSMAARLDRTAMRKAASAENALLLIANALRPIPGPKSLVMFGYGLGRFGRNGVTLGMDYAVARRALEGARASVFAIDITQADYHSLESGLGAVAEDTGGFYAKAYHFPKLAVDKLARTLVGHYELEVRRPDGLKRGVHEIQVDVNKRNAQVLARSTYVD